MGAAPAFALGVRLFAHCQVVVVVEGVAATHVVREKEEQSLGKTSGSGKERQSQRVCVDIEGYLVVRLRQERHSNLHSHVSSVEEAALSPLAVGKEQFCPSTAMR